METVNTEEGLLGPKSRFMKERKSTENSKVSKAVNKKGKTGYIDDLLKNKNDLKPAMNKRVTV